MKNLIKLQLRNLFHNKLFYIIFVITLLIFSISVYFNLEMAAEKIQVMPEIISLISSGLSITDIIFISLFSCLDFNESTTKNIIARGYKKRQLLFSKYIVSIMGVFIIFLTLMFLSFVIYLKNGIGYESGMFSIIIISLIGIVTSIIFYSTISFLLEKNSSALLVSILGPTLFVQVLGLIDNKLKINITKYWFENISSNYMIDKTFSNFVISLILYLIYIAIFILIGVKILHKKEIK